MGLALCFDNLIFFQMPNGQGRANRHEVYRKGGGSLVAKSCPTLATPWTVACQIPLSTGFSSQEYWSELPFPSPGDLTNPGIERWSPALQADSLPTELQGKPYICVCIPK